MRKFFLSSFLLIVAPLALAAPADGNGNKFAEYFEEYGIPIFCDADDIVDLTLDFVGWFQGHEFKGRGNRNVDITVYHFDLVYTNALGESWTWRDRGPDRFYYVVNELGDPELHWAITGRSGLNVVGHAVFNISTGEFVLIAGQQPFGVKYSGRTPTILLANICSGTSN
jgi:hypothetical protein